MATNDDRQALQRRFSGLTAVDRRAIVKAVNRGRAVETRKHAPLAVHIANRQMRFWKWSWVIGPAVGLLQIGQLGPAAAVLNALLATAMLGSMSAFFYLRAQRSAKANLELMGGRGPGPGFDQPEPKRRFWHRGGSHDTSNTSRRARGGAGTGSTSGRGERGDGAAGTRGERTRRRWWGGRDTRPDTTASGSGGHLPSRSGPTGTSGNQDGQGSPDTAQRPAPQADLPAQRRPYQPRGRKRRGR